MDRINRKEAERLFQQADQFYREQRYTESLEILDRLDRIYPNRHRVLFPRARCLAKLGRFDDALAVCQTLVSEHEYDKARPLLDKLVQHQSAPSTVELEPYTESGFETPPPTDGRAFDSKIDLKSPPPIGISAIERRPRRRFGIKTMPTAVVVLVGVAVWLGGVAWWIGLGIVVGYFAVWFAVRRLIARIFEAPFRMKGAALRNASADVHAVRACDPPELEGDAEGPNEPRAWYQIDVTITPEPNDGAFQMWEPGELALAPPGLTIRRTDDLDQLSPVVTYRFVDSAVATSTGDGDDDPDKVRGAGRIELTVGVPPDLHYAQFAYYFETFGELQLR